MNKAASPSHVIARFRDAAGQDVLGPRFDAQEADCRACLHTRVASCGLPAPRFVPCLPLSLEIGDVLDTHAALAGGTDTAPLARFLPLPTCRCSRAQGTTRGSLNLLDAVSPVFGPVRRVDLHPAPDGMTLAIARGARIRGRAGIPVAVVGSATDCDPEAAAARAVAEALERYAAGFWSDDALVHPTYRHVYGMDHETGQRVLVPAGEVFLPFDPSVPGDAAGLAAGATPEDAAARALAERIERDVAHPVFEGRQPATGPFDQDQILLGRDGEHEVWMTVRRADTPPFLAVGLGASRDPQIARAKSRAEAAHVAAHMTLLGERPPSDTSTDLGWLDAAVLELAFDASAARRFHERLAAGPRESPSAPPFRRRVTVDITTRDVAAFGLYVVRAISVPGG